MKKDEVGTREPTIQRQGADRILIQVPGIGSATELKALIGTTAQLTFQAVMEKILLPGRLVLLELRFYLLWMKKVCFTLWKVLQL